MNEENFEKFKNRNKKSFRNENGRKRNKRERKNTRYQGKRIIDDLISDGRPEYNRDIYDDKN